MSTSNTGTAKFLIVDDSRAIQSIIKRVIESCNYLAVDIRTANDGEAAIELLQTFRPDLIITDWHMQKIGGLEFCQHVCQSFSNAIPIGFVTTESAVDKIDQAYQSGAKFVINKPFQDTDLKAKLFKYVPNNQTLATHINGPLQGSHAVLAELLQGHDYLLEPCPPLTLKDFTDKNFLGLFGEDGMTPPVYSLAIMEMKAVGLLWAINTNQPGMFESFVRNSQPDNEQLNQARRFMDEFGAGISIGHKNGPLKLARSSIVNRDFPRLELSLNTNIGRSDYRLSVPDIGDGYISYIKLV